MSSETGRVTQASREIAANAAVIFELIADPAQQPLWDGNENLASAASGQRVHGVGDVFVMEITANAPGVPGLGLTQGSLRNNKVVEFVEGRLIAWKPSLPDADPPGHLWRWELTPVTDSVTLVTHTYDWTNLTDENRLKRARWTTPERLAASLDRLASLAEGD